MDNKEKAKIIKKIIENQEIIRNSGHRFEENKEMVSIEEVKRSFEEIDIKYRKREKISETVRNIRFY
jgi:PDZ domain-containing secreted protein